jgi:hypothetical protein
MIRLTMAIGRERDDRGMTKRSDRGAALGRPPAEATTLLTERHWRGGAVEQLGAATSRLGWQVPEPTNEA